VLYHTMDQFFARYLGGRSQTPVPGNVESRARTMTVQPDTLKLAAQADQKTSSP